MNLSNLSEAKKGKTMKKDDRNFLRVLGGMTLLWASYLLLRYASNLWLEKNGFWWGALILAIVQVQLRLVRYSNNLALSGRFVINFKSLPKIKEKSSEVALLVWIYLGLMADVGWEFICIGWRHWWTGVMSSLIFGPYLFGGALAILLAVYIFIVDIVDNNRSKAKSNRA